VEPGRPDEWLRPGRFALVLGALIVAAFPQVLLGLETFVVRDFGFFAYPLAHYQRECFWRGELPLWNPYNNCGIPFLAQWNTMPLYPPALFYLVLPLSWSLGAFCLLHLFWAGLGMYHLAYRCTNNRLGASVAGLVFAFNGFSLNLLMWPSHIATWSWMPWVIFCVERGWRDGGRKLVLAAVVGALQMLAGGPETILFTWFTLAIFWLVQLIRSGRGSPSLEPSAPVLKIGFRFPLMILLVAALAAAQLLPFLDLAAHSQREAGFADTRWSMPARGWANFLVPMAFGTTLNQNLFFQYGQYWTSSYYVGVGTLVLAVLALWKARGCRIWVLAGIAALGFVLASGDNLFVSRWIRRVVPQLSLVTYPIKYIALSVFSLPLLAGFGVAALRGPRGGEWSADEKRLLGLAAGAVALVGCILFWAWREPFPTDNVPATLHNGLARAAFVAILAGIWVALRRVDLPRLRHMTPVAFLVVLWLDVWTHEPRQNPTVAPTVYEPNLARSNLAMNPQPALGQTRALVAPAAHIQFTQLALKDLKQNYLAKRVGYFADCNLLDHVPKSDGFFSLYPRECGEFNSLLYLSTNACPPRLADFLAVSQLTSREDFLKWDPRSTFLPLATAGQQPVFMADTNALLSLVSPEFTPAEKVILPPEAQALVSVRNPTRATVNLRAFEAHRIDLDVEAGDASLVVVAQTFYHRWRAFIDGRTAPLLRANYAFQAIEVPPGKHQIRLAYRDSAFAAGAVFSGLTLVACLAGWMLSGPARQKPGGSPERAKAGPTTEPGRGGV
jgi:hypothetical protein